MALHPQPNAAAEPGPPVAPVGVEPPATGVPARTWHARARVRGNGSALGGNGSVLTGALRWLEARALLVVAVCAVGAISCAGIPPHLSQDGWLALVAGRIVAQHGIPHHDYLTVMAHGVRWIDQQWLAQLTTYGLDALGGLPLFTVVYVVLTTCAFGLAIAAARSLGAEQRHVIWVLPVGAFFYLATAVTIRTQGFAYPLFVATVWLLALEARKPLSRPRLAALFSILVVWANLHGSVTVGAGMVALSGLIRLWEGFRARRWRGLLDRRGLALAAGGPLCLFVTPYGLSIVSYYRATLFNSGFSKVVTEWQPVTSYTILAVPLLLLILVTVWTLGRSGRRTPAFDQIVLAVLALGAIDAVRNITWFGLAVVILLPPTITRLRQSPPDALRHRRLDTALAVGAIALFVLSVVVTLARPAAWFESTYPRRALATVERILARQPGARIFADVHYADWLVWHDPRLAGDIAYDTSFENLTAAQLSAIGSLGQARPPGAPDTLGPYAILVLPPGNKAANRVILARHGTRVVLRSKRVVIATKPST